MGRRSGYTGFMLGLLASVTAAGLVIGFGGFVSFVSEISEQSHLQHPSEPIDAIVVLTGGSERLSAGMTLLTGGQGQRLLISGINTRIDRTQIRKRIDPSALARFDCCVDLDKSARNTVGNAAETARWAAHNHYTRILVVTASYHMPRSLAEMNRAAPQITWVPHAVFPDDVHIADWWRWPGSARLLASEYVKYLAMQMRFRLEDV